jgi:hypothetical protein
MRRVLIGDVGMGGAGVVVGGPPPITIVQRGKVTIVINHMDKTITLLGRVEFYGDGATQSVVDNAVASINSTWSGTTQYNGQTYTVNSQISGALTSGSSPTDPFATQVQVKQTTDPPNVHKNTDPAFMHYNGSAPGMIHQNEDDGGTLTIPHEFGHAMGLKDEYTEGPRDASGNRTLTRTGPPGGLMGHIEPGSAPTDQNYTDLVDGTNLGP